ncbi:MAG: TonB C-terminal domain-containing protein [Burkholderiales bacterium]|nr:TonB C-terminal domain-containing protein [Burkholderiales bacterium]
MNIAQMGLHRPALILAALGLSACAQFAGHGQPAPTPTPTPEPAAVNATPPAPPQPSPQEVLADYVDHVRKRIRTNMVYKSRKPAENPEAVYQVVLLPDMTIFSVKVVTSSGNKRFDQAAKRAIEKIRSYPALPNGLEFSLFQTHKIKYRLHD